MTDPPFGVLPALKLPGPTSHDLVARARRLFGTRRVGHGGTLDPAAAGVLPLLLGPATRLARYLLEGEKSYRFWITFGVETDTGDQEGKVTRTAPAPGRQDLEAALTAFRGRIRQVPPGFSAVKSGGRVAHRLARAGEAFGLPERTVRVTRLELLDFTSRRGGDIAEAMLDMECSHGTYVRSLAVALATALGSAGHVSALLRTRSGSFPLECCVTLDEAAAQAALGTAPWWPPESAMAGHPKVDLDAAEAEAISHGRIAASLAARLVPVTDDPARDWALMADGRLVAAAGWWEGRHVLRAVFHGPASGPDAPLSARPGRPRP